MTEKHTPTPYRVGINKTTIVCDTPVPEINGSDDNSYGGHLIAESLAPRNAAHIVKCVNLHDELVEVLEAILPARPRENDSCHIGITPMEKCCRCSPILAGYAALAKARGEA